MPRTASQYENAVAEAGKAIGVDPNFAIAYYELAVNNVYLDRLGEAENVIRRAAARGLEIDEFVMLGYDIAFLRGDRAGMERQAARARGGSVRGKLDLKQRGVYPGILGSPATGTQQVAPGSGSGSARSAARESRFVGSRSSCAGGFVRKPV